MVSNKNNKSAGPADGTTPAPRKSLGQHWLNDRGILQQIVDIAEVSEVDLVLEIGPGLGTLTEFILDGGAKVISVELDRELFAYLEAEADNLFQENAANLTLVNEDILKYDLTSLKPDYKVIANIPYYLTSNLIRVLSESANPPQSVTLLIQKEVAQRLAAGPGKMSLLSVAAQVYYEPKLGAIVPAVMFTPPPKVDSQVIHLKRRSIPLFEREESRNFFRIVKAGFSNRRKTLLNSLAAGLHLSKEDTRELLEKAGVDPGRRAQDLSLDEWLKLAD